MRVHVDGTWPAQITLRKGWFRAAGRPWNHCTPMAQLRVDRGGASFLEDCVTTLSLLPDVEGVLSPPLPGSAQRLWNQAGFRPHSRLSLMRLDLTDGAEGPPPEHPVLPGDLADLDQALRIDHAAFEPFWRFDRIALLEAAQVTPRYAIHLVRRPGGPLAGFAVTGTGHALAYLQRLAVDPPWQGRGLGRSLVRAAAAWARAQGSQALLLNTPEGDGAATGLYRSEGFRTLPAGLAVLVRTG